MPFSFIIIVVLLLPLYNAYNNVEFISAALLYVTAIPTGKE